MKFTLIALATLTAAAPALASPSASAECAPPSAAEVEGQLQRFTGALASKDPATVANLFAPDAVLLPTLSNTPRTTPEAVRDYFVHFLAKSPVVSIDSSTVRSDCHLAERVGTWTWSLTDPATGAKSEARARYSFIYRLEGGRWWIDHLHSSLMPESEAKTAHR